METHFEKTLDSQVVYEGRVITVTRDTALLENGETALRDVVHHHGGACILPYFEDGTLCMVRQFRYAMQQELWELPAGKLEAGEDPFEAAKRELTEECGLYADEYISLGQVYPTVGYDTEIIYIWAARGLHPAHMHLDDDEFLTPERVPLQKAYEMILSNSRPCWTTKRFDPPEAGGTSPRPAAAPRWGSEPKNGSFGHRPGGFSF